MQPYELRVKFYSPVVFYDPPILDSLILYCIHRELNKNRCVYRTVAGEEHGVDGVRPMYDVIQCTEEGVFLSTQFLYERGVEFLDSWKKRFESKYHYLVDFGKGRRRVNISQGKYRSYDMPLPAHVVLEGWWLFIGDGRQVKRLMEDNLVAVGKKSAEGFGWIDSLMLIERPDVARRDILSLRPIPKIVAEKYGILGNERIMAWRPPYWKRKNQSLCMVP